MQLELITMSIQKNFTRYKNSYSRLDLILKYYLQTKRLLKKRQLKYLDIFQDHPYIFNLGHGVLPETDPNMFEYMVNTVKNY
jgi:hypothetical protein